MKEKLKDFVATVEKARSEKVKEQFDGWFFDYTIEYCDKNDLHSLFLDCKMNPVAFYAFAKYKTEDKSIEWLEKAFERV